MKNVVLVPLTFDYSTAQSSSIPKLSILSIYVHYQSFSVFLRKTLGDHMNINMICRRGGRLKPQLPGAWKLPTLNIYMNTMQRWMENVQTYISVIYDDIKHITYIP